MPAWSAPDTPDDSYSRAEEAQWIWLVVMFGMLCMGLALAIIIGARLHPEAFGIEKKGQVLQQPVGIDTTYKITDYKKVTFEGKKKKKE